MDLSDGKVETSDLALATVLVLHGFNPVMRKNTKSGKVVWYLKDDEVGGDVFELIDEYQAGAICVEPKRFLREVKNVREDMYRFLGVDGRSRAPTRRPV